MAWIDGKLPNPFAQHVRMIVRDNGTELTSNAVLAWCGDVGVEWHYIAPGKPMQNGYVER